MLRYGTGTAVVAAIALALACSAWAQEPAATNRIIASDGAAPSSAAPGPRSVDFREADFAHVAKHVGQLTGRRFVFGPGVCALITVRWETVPSDEHLYQNLLSVARSLGFVVVEHGSVTAVTLQDETSAESAAACRRYPPSG
jgi:type II secretory pathway component GspD/PulD (secretin)